MKLKLLSMFVALGLFAFGATGGIAAIETTAAETPAHNAKKGKNITDASICPGAGFLKTTFSTILCTAISLDPNCKTFCTNIGTSAKTDPKIVTACMTAVKAMPAVGSLLNAFITKGCWVACTAAGTIGCDSCSDPATLATCGFMCCPIDATTVQSCMTKYKKTCTDYMGAGSAKPI